jgi:hypothetical protein
MAACGQAGEEAMLTTPSIEEKVVLGDAYPASETPTMAYPGPGTTEEPPSGYPAPVNPTLPDFQPEPPDPVRDLPEPSGQAGVVGGVLIYEEPGVGYVPLQPVELILGELLYTDTGEAAYIRKGGGSPRAEFLPTGVFIFSTVPPGEYGLIVDMGYTELQVLDQGGAPTIYTIESGEALDLGQVIVELPSS